jgi:hypothetical protein
LGKEWKRYDIHYLEKFGKERKIWLTATIHTEKQSDIFYGCLDLPDLTGFITESLYPAPFIFLPWGYS